MTELLVSISNLQVQFHTYAGIVHALNGVTLDVYTGEICGLVGETGCGKSMTGLSVLRLIPRGGEVTAGSILFRGEEILGKSETEMQAIRGRRVAMVFQDPSASLNPVFTVGEQIGFVLRRHQRLRGREIWRRGVELLEMVELPNPSRLIDMYPHELSGGMRQRVCIAIALSCGAELLIADEPTTDLDVTIQAQILDLLCRLRESHGLTIMFITHDLAVVAETCQRVAVLYAGQVLEVGPVDQVLAGAKHPYTRSLLEASPKRDKGGGPLRAIAGNVPSGLESYLGCPFKPRCNHSMDVCSQPTPRCPVGAGHTVACFLYEQLQRGSVKL